MTTIERAATDKRRNKMTTKELAIEIIETQGNDSRWNEKIYGGAQKSIYLNNVKIDITEKIESIENFSSQKLVEVYREILVAAHSAGLDAMIEYKGSRDKNDVRYEARQNYINNLK